jgi:hypothetical protein
VIWSGSKISASKRPGKKSSRYDGEIDRKLWIRERSQQTLSIEGYSSPILSATKNVRNQSMKTLSWTLALYRSG